MGEEEDLFIQFALSVYFRVDTMEDRGLRFRTVCLLLRWIETGFADIMGPRVSYDPGYDVCLYSNDGAGAGRWTDKWSSCDLGRRFSFMSYV